MLENYAMFVEPLALVWVRALGLVAFLPLGGALFSRFLIALILGAPMAGSAAAGGLSCSSLLFEFAVGAVISLPLAAARALLGFLGGAMDSLRGETIGSIYDPQRNESISTYAAFFSEFAWAVFLAAGAFDNCAAFFYKTYSFIPSGKNSFDSISRLLELQASRLPGITAPCADILIAAAVIFLSIEISSAFVQKIFPRLQLDKEIFLVKTAAGFLILKGILDFSPVRGLLSAISGSGDLGWGGGA